MLRSTPFPSTTPSPSGSFQRRIAVLLLLAAGLAMFASGYASAVSPSEPPARVAGTVPTDFADHLGYQPVVQDGRPVNPTGSCSSPIPLPGRFEQACRAHDYGYDVLRYAAATGTTLPPHARADLDAALVADMHLSCTNPLCHVAAELSRAGLAFNTWRQRGGAPEPETGWQLASSVIVRVGQAAAGQS